MIALALALAVQHQHPAPPPPVQRVCSPEHAAMGHCKLPTAPPPTPKPAPAACPPEHAAMGHCTPAPAPSEPSGTDLAAGNAPAPPPPAVDAADRIFGTAAMHRSRHHLYAEHGGRTWSRIMIDQAEVAVREGRDGYRWQADAWFGGDRNRLVLKTEGEGDFGAKPESAEVQALYSRAIGPYFDIQAGVRHEVLPNPSRTHAVLGFEGLAPYWFDVETMVFLSNKGEVTARAEATYDQRITQQIILQPRAEMNLCAQDVPALGLGSGVTDIELGLRLRYEIVSEFAPYVGVNWSRKVGDTARFARADGEDASQVDLVLGIRARF